MADKKSIEGSQTRKESTKKESKDNKALRVVTLRNRFFFIMYRQATLIFFFSLIMMLVSVGMVVYVASKKVSPQFIPLKPDGRLMEIKPTNIERFSKAEVASFAIKALKKIHTYDYVNYSEQMQESMEYFTPQGWKEYLQSLKDSQTLESIKANKYIVGFKITGAPKFQDPIATDTTYMWTLILPVKISFIINGEESASNSGQMFVRISTISVIDNPHGMAINQLVFKPDETVGIKK